MRTDPFVHLRAQVPHAVTKRLALRALTPADAGPLYGATFHPEFNKNLMWSRPDSHEQVQDRVNQIIRQSEGPCLAAFCAVNRQTGEWVSLYRLIMTCTHEAEMGLWTHPSYWGGGYGTELTHAAIDLAFRTTDLNTLMAAASPSNPGACRVLEKCGLEAGPVESRMTDDGRIVPLIQFRIKRPVVDPMQFP